MKLLVVSAAWVGGTAAAFQWDIPLASVVLFLVASCALGILCILRKWRLLPAIALIFALLGALRVGLAPQGSLELQPWIGAEKSVEVEGQVMEDPEARGSALRFRFQAQRINRENGWREASGDILVTARPSADMIQKRQSPYIRYGDLLVLRGRLEEPPVLQDFDYRAYLAHQGIQAVMGFPQVALVGDGQGSSVLSLIYRLRGSLARALAASLPEPQASLAQTLLLGARGGVPPEVTQAFRNTGTSHLLAISGLHVGVALALSLAVSTALLGRKRNLYLLLPLGFLWVYALLATFSPSVARAVVMASLYLLALALGRQRSAITALGFAAALMVALEPGILYRISFQLSFTAVAGILLLWPPLERTLDIALERILATGSWQEAVARWVATGLGVGLAATVATLPLLAFNFHYIALLGIPATLLALPALPFILVTSLATALAGMATPLLGQAVGWIAWLPLSYLLAMVEGLSRLPNTVIQVERISGLLVWGYYGLAPLLLALWLRRSRLASLLHKAKGGRAPRAIRQPDWPVAQTATVLSLAVVAVLAWTANASLPDGKLHVAFLDVGQGDAIFVQTPEGQQIVIDGGPDPRRLLKALGKQMPFWDRSIDLVVLSHAHSDHLAGLVELVRRYRVSAILDNPYDYPSSVRTEWLSVREAEGATIHQALQGQIIKLGNNVTLEVLNPPIPLIGGTPSDVDNNATVIRLRHGNSSFLLTGDLQGVGEAFLLERGLDVQSTVLKAAHHGSKTSSTPQFLGAVRPQLAVVSVGKGNPYSHPNKEVMDRLTSLVGDKERLLTTEDHGNIVLACDGQKIRVRTQQ